VKKAKEAKDVKEGRKKAKEGSGGGIPVEAVLAPSI
jgi:hypothetical protein